MKYIMLTGALFTLLSSQSWAGDKLEAAIGGGAGGAVGAVIGDELGDRNGAIIGAAAGAAIGVAIATDDDKPSSREDAEVIREISSTGHPQGRHCPPGQAKKGRC